MRLLLDTHVLLWWLDGAPSLSGQTYRAIEVDAEEVLVSAASIWEIEVKRLKGTLAAPENIVDRIEGLGFLHLDITSDHALDAARLPSHHRDPFDRFLVAQAQGEAAVLVTATRRSPLTTCRSCERARSQSPSPRTPSSSHPRWWASSWRTVRTI